MDERITPENLEGEMPKGFKFVAGTNESGIHGSGSAAYAYKTLGARLNQGFGPMGASFGIPTKDWNIKTLPLPVIKSYVDRFIAYVDHSEWKFYVTKIGCGLAGYTPEDIAPMFKELRNHKRVWLPREFIDIIDAQPTIKEVMDKLEADGY